MIYKVKCFDAAHRLLLSQRDRSCELRTRLMYESSDAVDPESFDRIAAQLDEVAKFYRRKANQLRKGA